eukprot:CAMPEP_0194756170 /NCGR_PEP_ID=MMETSP0323_2-20130528/9919_1 /TAXON_ID=2866 ORGANISM="Crypthecodinium cohnii, Strain Seligo" /NCGR_SAMPLE_ID=MMETSP0323_2 /ASSEMBLY_ACC=CAM_ASM_000346 /LENGTH=107 /DNA_ID=CAMNT_0039675561 /DNA_START=51 /DNA_END=374 /DNA_ORIENTATION=-
MTAHAKRTMPAQLSTNKKAATTNHPVSSDLVMSSGFRRQRSRCVSSFSAQPLALPPAAVAAGKRQLITSKRVKNRDPVLHIGPPGRQQPQAATAAMANNTMDTRRGC